MNEIKCSDYNIRIVESPSQNETKNKLKFVKEIGSSTFYKTNKKDEEAKFEIEEIRKNDITSEEFFMKRSQMNYIKKNLSPVKGISIKNPNLINNNNLNTSMNRIFSAKTNNYGNLIKSDIILLCNLIQKNSYIINYFKHQYQNEIDSSKGNIKMNKNFNISNNSILSKLSLQNILIQKRCLEIENDYKENFSEIINKLNDNSKNIDYLMNNYKCLGKEELVFKIASENFLNQLLIKKVDDLFFLNNLKNLNENYQFCNNYSETHSKIQNIKNFLELFETVIPRTNDEKILNTKLSINSIKTNDGIIHDSKKLNRKPNKKFIGVEEKNICIFDCEFCNEKYKENNYEDYEKYCKFFNF